MANEISTTATLTCTKSGATVTGSSTLQINLAGAGKFANVQAIGNAADELLVFPADLVTEGVGYIWLKNLDPTNYIELSMGTGGSFAGSRFAKLKAGETAMFRTFKAAAQDPAIYAQAATASCNLQIVAVGT